MCQHRSLHVHQQVGDDLNMRGGVKVAQSGNNFFLLIGRFFFLVFSLHFLHFFVGSGGVGGYHQSPQGAASS